MAIFSQEKERTKLDFRNYNSANPNTNTPYSLPNIQKEKIHKLLLNLKLNCCSIDMIKGKDNQYYFLEINPIGQFGMTNYPCNYNLYKKIADTLIKIDKDEEKIHT